MNSQIKLLIIGAKIGQVPLICKAHVRDIHVTSVSPRGNYPSIELANGFYVSLFY